MRSTIARGQHADDGVAFRVGGKGQPRQSGGGEQQRQPPSDHRAVKRQSAEAVGSLAHHHGVDVEGGDRGWRQEEKIASIAVPVCSQQRVIGCLNLVYIASAMTIEQAAQKHLRSKGRFDMVWPEWLENSLGIKLYNEAGRNG